METLAWLSGKNLTQRRKGAETSEEKWAMAAAAIGSKSSPSKILCVLAPLREVFRFRPIKMLKCRIMSDCMKVKTRFGEVELHLNCSPDKIRYLSHDAMVDLWEAWDETVTLGEDDWLIYEGNEYTDVEEEKKREEREDDPEWEPNPDEWHEPGKWYFVPVQYWESGGERVYSSPCDTLLEAIAGAMEEDWEAEEDEQWRTQCDEEDEEDEEHEEDEEDEEEEENKRKEWNCARYLVRIPAAGTCTVWAMDGNQKWGEKSGLSAEQALAEAERLYREAQECMEEAAKQDEDYRGYDLPDWDPGWCYGSSDNRNWLQVTVDPTRCDWTWIAVGPPDCGPCETMVRIEYEKD